MNAKRDRILVMLIFIFMLINFLWIPQNAFADDNSTAIDYIMNNWLNYVNGDGRWHVTTINGYPAIGTTYNSSYWTGFLNNSKAGQTTIDAEFDFHMIQNEPDGEWIDDDNLGWTFRHTYVGDYSNINNHYFYAFISNGGGANASGLYKRTGSTFTRLVTINHTRVKGKDYHIQISVKDEEGGTRIKIYIDGTLVVNYLDTNPLRMGGYGPIAYSQAYGYFHSIQVNGASFLNIPPSITVSSPSDGQTYRHGNTITISGSMNDEDARGTLSVYYSVDGGEEVLIKTVDSDGKEKNFSTTYTIPSNLSDGMHTLRIWVKDSENGQSEIVTRIFYVYTIPKIPLSRGYDNITENSVRLLWNPNGNSDAISYHYEVRRKSDNSIVTQGIVNGTSVTVTGLTGGHEQYRYFVRAMNGNGEFTDFVELSIPSLTVYQKSNYVKAEWAVEMLDEDILYITGFEEGDELPRLTYNASGNRQYGGQSFTTEEKYSGERSLKVEDSYTNGNYRKEDLFGNISYEPYSVAIFGQRKYMENGTNLSVSFRAKTTGEGQVRIWGNGGVADYGTPLNNIIFLEDVHVGDTTVKVNNPGFFKNYVDKGQKFYLANQKGRYDYIYVVSVDMENSTITVNKPFQGEFKKGENVLMHNYRGPVSFNSRTIYGDEGWQLFNVNTQVADYPDYNTLLRGFELWIMTTTHDIVYIDDLKVGYATKTELYRDGVKIYEGYLSDYDDYEAVDKEKPNAISSINVTNEAGSNTVKITFSEPKDYGTTYTYQVKAIPHDIQEPINSEIKSITITSGIKGYSYVIDSDPNTIPDNVVDVVVPEIKAIINPNVKNYVHIKVIDNEGNASEVFHQEIGIPVLTATPNNEEDYIHLEWIMNDTSKKYSYMAYKREESESEFQSIPLKDNVKVLNIYPGVGNNLKTWMETNGYGKGKIKVDEVHIDDFNNNPSYYLKDAEGNWKYDVVYMGAWDTNNGKNLNDNALAVVSEFIDSGRGFLAGHDTLGYTWGINRGLNKIRDKFNIKVGYWGPDNISLPTDEGFHYFGGYVNNKIIVKRKGLLTNYPWKIGDVGTVLTVPRTHSTSNFAFGDIWMVFPENQKYDGSNFPDSLNTYANFYLTTWNNTAMIQTGHSNGQATEDEQKLLANTLFYLAQISEDTSWDDHSGQDIHGPTKPIITQVKIINNGNTIYVKYTESEDIGTKYYYYVEGTANNTLVQSNIAEATIKTGLKGYSIVIDQNTDTIPDTEIETTGLEYTVNRRFYQKFYVHVAAVDNVGNISEVAHYEYSDTNKPGLTITGNPTDWTKDNVILTAKAVDGESGIYGIKLPNGNWVYSDTATFEVSSNGTYIFVAEDYFGNQTTVTVEVTKIDKTPPFDTSIIINNDDLYTNDRNVILTINARDNGSGVVAMRFKTENGPWTEWVPYATSFNYTMDAGFTRQGTNRVYVQFKDKAGNIGGDAFDSIVFDSIAPTGEIVFNKQTVNSRNIVLTINAYDINPANADIISGLNAVRFRELQNEVVKQDWTSWEQYSPIRYWILSDGDGTKVIEMEIRDNAGNISKVSKSMALDTLFIKEALFTDIVNPPLGNPELPTSEVVKVKKGYEFTFIVRTSGNPDKAIYTFNGETGEMDKITDNLFRKTLKVDINDNSVNNEILPIKITVLRNDGAQKTTTLKVYIEGSAYEDYNINLTN